VDDTGRAISASIEQIRDLDEAHTQGTTGDLA